MPYKEPEKQRLETSCRRKRLYGMQGCKAIFFSFEMKKNYKKIKIFMKMRKLISEK